MKTIKIIQSPLKQQWAGIFARSTTDDGVIKQRVESILSAIRQEGDTAIFRLTQEIDKVELSSSNVKVSKWEIEQASARLSSSFKKAIRVAKKNIEAFHLAQLRSDEQVETMPGVVCSRRRVAIESVGLYIPGGSAPLFSTVLMSALPAQIAGCTDIVMCTPPSASGVVADEILYCAQLCGVNTIYKLGGAIAIGAMAYGSKSVKAVDKIFGPGNRYVTYAKQYVASSCVAIDMPAGPSEVMIVADESSVPAFVAADLLSQLEHGSDSQALALVSNLTLAQSIALELETQAKALSRTDILAESISNCTLIVEPSISKMLSMVNYYAPEHLIVSLTDADTFAHRVSNAGSVFIGNYSPESVGDYASGTNHTLPTSAWSKSYSGINIDSFSKYITYQKLSPEGLKLLAPTVELMAKHEGLTAHANAVKIRLI